MTLDNAINDLGAKDAVIGIIGLGYVGLPLILAFADAGYKTVGFDIDERKVASLNAGESYIKHISSDSLQAGLKGDMTLTSDMAKVADVDAIILCVPTPLNQYREPDLTYITNTMDVIAPFLREGHVLSLESTTYPGTTEDVILPYFTDKNLTAGESCAILYSPEREDPGNKNFTTRTIPKVVGGVTDKCLKAGIKLYESIVDTVVPVSSVRVAEMTKLLENIHRSVNIGLANEMKVIADKMGIDIFEVVDAAATKPFGFVPYYPGPGVGGHCIPIDPFYLTWKAKEYDVHTRFIELAGEINDKMPSWVVGKLSEALNRHEKPIKNSKVLLLGLAYKKHVDDMRESPCLVILDQLLERGALVEYSDPYIPHIPKLRKYDFDMSSVDITPSMIASYDAVIIGTDHDDFDYDLIVKSAKLIVDTRGVYRGAKADNIVSA